MHIAYGGLHQSRQRGTLRTGLLHHASLICSCDQVRMPENSNDDTQANYFACTFHICSWRIRVFQRETFYKMVRKFLRSFARCRYGCPLRLLHNRCGKTPAELSEGGVLNRFDYAA